MFSVAEDAINIQTDILLTSKSLLSFASWDSLSSYFAGEKVWRCSSFSSVSSLARFVVVECREKCSFFSASWTDFFFFSSWLLDSYTSISSMEQLKSLIFQRWYFSFSFTKAKDEIRNLSSSKSCRCLQAQWWKVKSLLDRWNLPSGYVSSMESNCWTSENFLSVD